MGRTSDAKERLIAACASLVHRRGYAAVGVDEICEAAGVRKGSFYYFFSSKRDLMLAALERQQAMAESHVFSVVFGESDEPPLRRLDRFFATIAEMEAAQKKRGGQVLGCPFGNIAAESAASDPHLARAADTAFCGFASFVRQTLAEAKARGDLARNVDVAEAAEAIVAYFEGIALLARARNDPSLLTRLGARAILLATGVTKGARSPRKRA